MQITEIMSDGLQRELEVTIPYERLNCQLEKNLEAMKGRVRIAGFRPGCVPVAHLRRIYGHSVMMDVIQETVNETTKEAIRSRNEQPAFQPHITLNTSEEYVKRIITNKTGLSYSVSFEIMPVIDLIDFSEIELNRLVSEVSKDDIDTELNQIAQNNRTYIEKSAGVEARKSDRVTIDFTGMLDGKSFEGSIGNNVQLILGSDFYIPGFSDQLIGTKAGDEIIIEVVFPQNHGIKKLAGKSVNFTVNIKNVFELGKITVNDTLAESLGFENLAKLQEAVSEQLAQQLQQISKYRLKRELLDALDERYDFKIPQTLVKQELEAILRNVQRDKTYNDEINSEDEQRALYSKIANRRVRLGLVLSHIGTINNTSISEQEFNQALNEQIRQFPAQKARIHEYYKKNPEAMRQLSAPIFEEKVMNIILSQVKINDVLVEKEELLRDPDEEQVIDQEGSLQQAKKKVKTGSKGSAKAKVAKTGSEGSAKAKVAKTVSKGSAKAKVAKTVSKGSAKAKVAKTVSKGSAKAKI